MVIWGMVYYCFTHSSSHYSFDPWSLCTKLGSAASHVGTPLEGGSFRLCHSRPPDIEILFPSDPHWAEKKLCRIHVLELGYQRLELYFHIHNMGMGQNLLLPYWGNKHSLTSYFRVPMVPGFWGIATCTMSKCLYIQLNLQKSINIPQIWCFDGHFWWILRRPKKNGDRHMLREGLEHLSQVLHLVVVDVDFWHGWMGKHGKTWENLGKPGNTSSDISGKSWKPPIFWAQTSHDARIHGFRIMFRDSADNTGISFTRQGKLQVH